MLRVSQFESNIGGGVLTLNPRVFIILRTAMTATMGLFDVGGGRRKMKQLIPLLLTVLLCMAAACTAQEPHRAGAQTAAQAPPEADPVQDRVPAAGATNATDFTSGQVLVRFRDGIEPEEIERIAKQAGLRILRAVSPDRLYLMGITDGSPVENMLERLKGFPEIVYAEPNHPRTLKRN